MNREIERAIQENVQFLREVHSKALNFINEKLKGHMVATLIYTELLVEKDEDTKIITGLLSLPQVNYEVVTWMLAGVLYDVSIHYNIPPERLIVDVAEQLTKRVAMVTSGGKQGVYHPFA